MLVDSGSTYNVLHLSLGRNLGCSLIPLLTPLIIAVVVKLLFVSTNVRSFHVKCREEGLWLIS